MHLGSTIELKPFMSRLESVSGECEKHGAYKTMRGKGTDDTVCPVCNEEKMRAEDRDAAFRRRVVHLSDVSGIPNRYASAGIKNYSAENDGQRYLLREAAAFTRKARDHQGWAALTLTGGPGTGKTHVACAIANILISYGVSCRYTTAMDMVNEIRRAYSEEGKTEAGQIELFTRGHSLLIVDEVDVMRQTKSESDLLLITSVINERYASERPVIAISNQSFDSLSKILGPRITSRLSENGVTVPCEWGDYRTQRRAT